MALKDLKRLHDKIASLLVMRLVERCRELDTLLEQLPSEVRNTERKQRKAKAPERSSVPRSL
jgi:hypothetical protein